MDFNIELTNAIHEFNHEKIAELLKSCGDEYILVRKCANEQYWVDNFCYQYVMSITSKIPVFCSTGLSK